VTPARAEVAERGRLFVALDLDEKVRSALASWGAETVAERPGIRPVADAALHVTLCFLGACAIADVDAIAAACAVEPEGPGRLGGPISGLRLGAGVWLPRRRPRVLAVAIEDDEGALARVQSALARALRDGGWYRAEARPYLAHVTVARVASDQPLRAGPLPPPPPVALPDTVAVTLYRSHLSSRGSRYEVVRVIPVAPAGAVTAVRGDPSGCPPRQ
jgi:RNA 2',3'-cyclic 3'-phosphodiesterase